MAFQVSPGVNVTEIDLTTVVPAVSTTEGAIAGVFRWGPVGQRVLIESEVELYERFGKPYRTFNEETWFTAASFLSYGNKLYVARAANCTVNTACMSAVANTGEVANLVAQVVKTRDDYDTKDGNFDSDVLYVAKWPGAIGNSLRIAVCDSANAYTQTINLQTYAANASFTFNSNSVTVQTQDAANATALSALLTVGDYIEVGNTTIGKQKLKLTSVATDTANVDLTFEDTYRLKVNTELTLTMTRYWEFYNVVDKAPGTSSYVTNNGNTSAVDEMHVVIIDEDAFFTGTPGAILEVHEGLSRATDAKTDDGSTLYYKTVINDRSQYVWWANDRSNAVSNASISIASSTNDAPLNINFELGSDGGSETNESLAVVAAGYDLFASAEDVDISLVLQGKTKGNTDLANYIIDNICETRKDCVAFISPAKADVVDNVGNEADDIISFRNSVRSSSYAVIDSGYKYMYDKYNDLYRWVPLNGDIAGLCVRTDSTNDPWWSPAGFNRGQIRNVVRLAYNPSKTDRDVLYKAGVNPVTTFPGQGTILFGDKTALTKPSAFDRINVRRLFIVLEKAISTAAKFTLFEFNDDFTRAQFKNLVTPYLRDVQGRRGITDFYVVCDDSNNTAEVIDRNEFIGDIYIKPARSINFIQLNFVAVRTGVAFSEIIGRV